MGLFAAAAGRGPLPAAPPAARPAVLAVALVARGGTEIELQRWVTAQHRLSTCCLYYPPTAGHAAGQPTAPNRHTPSALVLRRALWLPPRPPSPSPPPLSRN